MVDLCGKKERVAAVDVYNEKGDLQLVVVSLHGKEAEREQTNGVKQ